MGVGWEPLHNIPVLSNVPDLSRRQLLALLAGSAGAVAGGSYLLNEDDPAAGTQRLEDEDESRRLAEAHAPTLYFGTRERWFPTDPRSYASEQDGERLVTGFDALDGYSSDMREAEAPPNPMTFYQVLEYPDSPLACVQYWFYSAFDQFTTNFHWHDWEVLHVYVDRSMSAEGSSDGAETSTEADASTASGTAGEDDSEPGVPVLLVASAHSRKIPNNEYIDPPVKPAAIISEVGSHSSTLGVNTQPSSFQRTSLGDLAADISNNPVEIIAGESSLPLAYGLPRDEGLNLPFAVPELEGEPLPSHDQLPNLQPGDLLPADISVESYDALASPPESIPKREGDYSFVPGARADVEGDVQYELVHIDEVRDIDGFTGPTLSFSFRVPEFAEDAFSKHLSTPGVPWDQDRFTKPTTDISDPQHRAALAERYEPINEGGSASRILGAVREATGSDDAPGSNGVSLLGPSIEMVALLESEPEAVPSFTGFIAIEDPPEGEHRFTVNGAGMAPYGQSLTVDGESDTRVGVAGEVPMASNEEAVKVEGETADGSALDALSFDDDFAGTFYDAKPPGEEGTFGIYAHRDGAYTTEVRDENGNRGARRVNPNADDETIGLDRIETGKAPLADYLVRFLVVTRGQAAVFEDGTPRGIDDVPTGQDVTDAVVRNAVSAAEKNAGDIVENVEEELETVLRTDRPTGTNQTETDRERDTETPTSTATATAEATATESEGTVTGTETTESSTDSGATATEEATETPTDSDVTATQTGTDTPVDPAGTGFTGVLKSIDASLLVAVAARENARVGKTVQADRRLEALGKRLVAVQAAVERSKRLPEKLGPLASNRVDQMLSRVQAALDAD
ncbi:MAG: hypothetical protein V5A56_04180 [Halolamina sp.]